MTRDADGECDGRWAPSSARAPGSAVLDEAGMGLVLLDAAGEVAATNAIADELLRRRTARGSLVAELLAQARAADSAEAPGDQRVLDVTDDSGRRSLVGYRVVRSPKLGTILTLRDITEVEQARAERHALERLSQVGRACAMVAHEIGNPLAAIKATLQSIEREAGAAGLSDPIVAVFREIDRLDKILGQLLAFVRHRPPRRVRTDLAQVIARAKAAAGARLGNVAFHGPTPRQEAADLHGDPDQLQQVFLNLFLNAADAMDGRGDLWVRVGAGADRITICVEDSGPGVPPSMRERVFDSFFTTRPAGVGLGLPVCLRIVSDHGGSIAIADRGASRGACVRITLPLGAPPGNARRERHSEEPT